MIKNLVARNFHLLGLTAVLLILSWFAIRTQTFYSNDIGLRYLQAQQLIAQNWQSAHIPYPSASYDPDFLHVPYYYGYSIDDVIHLFEHQRLFSAVAFLCVCPV